MKKTIIGFILGGILFGTVGVVASTTISSKNVVYQNKTVNNALDELYNEAITGKELVAAAITNKGITTTSNDTYEVMASNINNIDTDHTEINQKISNLESKHNSDIASLTGSISNLNQSLTTKAVLLKKMFSGTTDSNGFISLGISTTNYIIESVEINGISGYFAPIYYEAGGYSTRILNWDMTTKLPNTKVSGYIFYIEKP